MGDGAGGEARGAVVTGALAGKPVGARHSHEVLRARLEERCIPEPMSGCWLWTAAENGVGYGAMWDGAKTRGAHRLMYEVTTGPIPDGFDVCHRCDNRICVNPDHLFAGTRLENVTDMDRKGRRKTTPILTAEQVLDIRARAARGERTKDLARMFGVSQPTISAVKHRINWAHLEEE